MLRARSDVRTLIMISWRVLRQEPFRLLFPLGVLFGCLGIGHWLVYALGWWPTGSGFYHASIQIGTYMACFILGFLMTALPRFANAAPATTWELLIVLGALAAQLMLLSLGRWIAAQGCGAVVWLMIAVFAGRRFAQRSTRVGPPTEFVWMFAALLLGLLGTALLTAGQLGWCPAWALAIGRPMAQQGVMLGIVLGVGGFMAPRLMGMPIRLATPTDVSPERAQRMRRHRAILHGLAAMLLAASFVMEGLGAVRGGYGIRAVVVTSELIWTTRFVQVPRAREFYARLVWLSLWCIVAGLWGVVVWPHLRLAMLHLVFIGGFSLMTFAVGTMVVLSHTGEGHRLQRPLWVLRLLAVGIPLTAAARVLAECVPAWYTPLLGLAAGCWLVVGIAWLVFALPRVAHTPAPGSFEHVHAEATRRLLEPGVRV